MLDKNDFYSTASDWNLSCITEGDLKQDTKATLLNLHTCLVCYGTLWLFCGSLLFKLFFGLILLQNCARPLLQCRIQKLAETITFIASKVSLLYDGFRHKKLTCLKNVPCFVPFVNNKLRSIPESQTISSKDHNPYESRTYS